MLLVAVYRLLATRSRLGSQPAEQQNKRRAGMYFSSTGWLLCYITNDGKKLKRFKSSEEVFLSKYSKYIGLEANNLILGPGPGLS